ncbi:uncharacterized protein LOC130612883 [Hydractinia symbiolongicarpus]|uniref:uncharacterized protein LOC130612883 n=1 Tax=Hydractinia symbiolongicarpus TaxID=13093 RepID=UPI002550E363|nr:uncharacterized protein LOC130612883 [Hydractinia symbiolongicarpus]
MADSGERGQYSDKRTIFFRVLVLVFIFLARLRFPKCKSIAQVIRDRYGESCVKVLRRFEKSDFKLRKAKLDLDFLCYCRDNDLVPKFLHFRLANRGLQNSNSYKQCQRNLLKEEIHQKTSRIHVLENGFDLLHSCLKERLSVIDLAHVCSIFLGSNDRILKKQELIQDKKIANLKRLKPPTNDVATVIFNFSKHILTDFEKSLLVKGLNFSVPPQSLNYGDYLVNYETLFRDIRGINLLNNEDLDFVKTRIKDVALSTYRSYNDKVDKDIYNNRMEEILSDSSKFRKLSLPSDKLLNFTIGQERKITNIYKALLKSGGLSEANYNKFRPVGSKPGILYGLCKVHKKCINGCPPFRPILSAIGIPVYKLAKFFVPVLSNVTKNEYTVHDSFSFAEDIIQQDGSLYMASLDIDSLFTNIPLNETIEICTNLVFDQCDRCQGLTRSEFKSLLELATKESYFIFNDKIYQQIDGTEKNNKLSFLDISITRDVDRKFITSIYRKPTFSGVYTHFDSFILESYKFGLIYTLLHRCFKICSSWSIFHHEVIRIKDIFIRNGYPELFIDKVKPSLQTRTKLEKLFKSTLHCCKLSIVFRTHTRLSNFFRFKDLLPKELKSGVIYKYKCSGCNATYIGETSCHLKVRASEHLGVSPLTGKKSTSSICTAIKDHLKACHTTSSLDDFSILSRGNNRYLLEIKESLFIMRDSH